jgi:hypothetical protein
MTRITRNFANLLFAVIRRIRVYSRSIKGTRVTLKIIVIKPSISWHPVVYCQLKFYNNTLLEITYHS